MKMAVRLLLILSTFFAISAVGYGQPAGTPTARPLAPLGQVKVPEPSNLGEFIKDRHAAIALGKALFWDMQAGSDGQVACATCHWHAGADSRFRGTFGSPKDKDVPIGDVLKRLTEDDFPLVKISGDPTSPDAFVVENNELTVGSQGAFLADFVRVVEGRAVEKSSPRPDDKFNVNGTNVRTVTGRNSPTVINAAFNHRQNWDGRSDFFFNGVNQSGQFDPDARVLKTSFSYRNSWDLFLDNLFGTRRRAKQTVTETHILLDNGALASQAMAPPLETEMGSVGRTLPDLGRKLLSLRPLGKQRVYFTDSALGKYDRFWGTGLRTSYAHLIRRAFKDEWWAANGVDHDGFTQMEKNFGLFWGLSIQMYQATLISDQTPLDHFLAGDSSALSPEAQAGLSIFTQGCNICHSGPETTSVAVGEIFDTGTPKPVTIMTRGVNFNEPRFYDRGFYNIGVQPIENDLGGARSNEFGVFSYTLRAQAGEDVGQTVFDAPVNAFPPAIRGTFKTPNLRNVELTGPYNHNGGKLTLEQVVQFYTRGADFRRENIETLDQGVSGIPQLQAAADVAVPALVAFLKSMTDERVRNQEEPFDHPELFLPDGVESVKNGRVRERILHFPAVGSFGVTRFFVGTVAGEPFKTFEERLKEDDSKSNSKRWWAHP
jgi:cytochrome c peroxidase